jgi:hypothetical protein
VGRRLLVTCGLLLGMTCPAATSMAAGWSSATATVPADAAANPFVSLGSASCGSAGDCGAVGTYLDGSGGRQGLLVTEAGGVWQSAVAATPPAGGRVPAYVTVGSVSCPAAGSCSAVGEYADSSSDERGLLLSESAGTWQPGLEASLPADALANPNVALTSVSCAAVGECTAVGTYAYTGAHTGGLLLTEASGTWQTGTQATLPANSDLGSSLRLAGVSCPSVGNCAAAGGYRDDTGHFQGILLTQTGGSWQPGVEMTLPANAAAQPRVVVTSVSCAAAGECSAVGTYVDAAGDRQGLLVVQAAGAWQPGVEVTLPANALGSGQAVALNSVSCGAAGGCSAVGSYTDSANGTRGLLVTETAGAWQPAIEARPPANARPAPYVGLSAVSCASSGECTAVGYYADTDSNTQELWLTETAGTWGTGVEAALPPDADADPGAAPSSVACAAPQDCSAVGTYRNGAGHRQGLLAAPLGTPAVVLSVPASGTVGSGVAAASIAAALSAGSSPAGTATFSVYGPQSTPPSSCAGGGTTVGTAAVSGDGTYHPSAGFTPAAAGDYWWYVSYAGDMHNSPAASPCGAAMAETVVSAPSSPGGLSSPSGPAGGSPTPTATATSVVLSSSANPSVSGQRVTYTAAISPAPDGGTVRFLAGGRPLAGCAAVPVDPGHGTATCAGTSPRPGAYEVQADYAGDARFIASQSPSLRQVVRSSIALVGRPSGRSGRVSLAVRCARESGGCSVTVVLSATHRRGHGRLQHVTIASTRTVRVAAGKTVTITTKLNPAGRRLIAGLKRLPVRLTLSLVVSGAHVPVATRAVTVTAPKPVHHG